MSPEKLFAIFVFIIVAVNINLVAATVNYYRGSPFHLERKFKFFVDGLVLFPTIFVLITAVLRDFHPSGDATSVNAKSRKIDKDVQVRMRSIQLFSSLFCFLLGCQAVTITHAELRAELFMFIFVFMVFVGTFITVWFISVKRVVDHPKEIVQIYDQLRDRVGVPKPLT